MALSVGSNVAEMKAGDNKASLFDEYDFVTGGMLEEVKDFAYTGAEQSYSVKQTGKYKLQVWGAEGGYARGSSSLKGGRGGYSEGIVKLAVGETLYAYVGGRGANGTTSLTGAAFNGGGKGGYSNYSSSNWQNGGGGGGTDFRIGGNTLYHRLIVAGGGGGGTPNKAQSNGHGGGVEGGTDYAGKQGTQTGGNAFGVGGSSTSNGEGNRYSVPGGGGGWYGAKAQTGGSSSDSWSDSSWYTGGGSGFIWEGQSSVPSGYLVQSKYILELAKTVAGSQSHESVDGGTETGHIGSGYARISAMGLKKVVPTYVTSAGAYHNSELGLISISTDGENWFTISDKNVGASSSDVTADTSYGNVFQYGNTHGFPGDGDSTAFETSADIPDLTGYEGGNLFSSALYRTNSGWNAANSNLWKGVAFTNLLSLYKGPCPKGFHVPTEEEFQNMLDAILELAGEGAEMNIQMLKDYILLPNPNSRNGSGVLKTSSTYLTNSYYDTTHITGFVMSSDGNEETLEMNSVNMNEAGYVRPFRDVAMIPTTEWTRLTPQHHTVRLPLEYQEVAWIGRAGGTQAYIDTGWIPKRGDGFKVEMGLKIESSGYRHCFLTNRKSNNSSYPFSLEINSSSVTNNRVRAYSESGSNNAIEFYSSNSLVVGEFNDVSVESIGKIDLNGTITNGTLYSGNNYYNATELLFIDREMRWSEFNHSMYVSYFKIYEGGVLTHDYVPCYRRIDKMGGLYDLVTETFHGNSGSGSFLTGAEINIPYIPEEYTQIEYIQSSGTQHIDTGFLLDTTARMDNFELRCKASHTGAGNFIGSKSAVDSPTYVTLEVPNSYNTTLRRFNGNSSTNSDWVVLHDSYSAIDDMYYGFTSSLAKWTVNGSVYTQSRSSGYNLGNHPFYIFCRNKGDNTTEQNLSMRLYELYIAVSGKLERFFVPCYRNSDNKPGLYDLINDQFYVNNGSGEFTCGGELIRHYENNEHTILYWPLSGTSKDLSGTNSDGVAASISYPDINGTKVAQFTAGSSNIYNDNSFIASCNGTKKFTYALWFKLTSMPSGSGNYYYVGWTGQSNYGSFDKCLKILDTGALDCYNYTTQSYNVTAPAGTIEANRWYCFVYTYDGANVKIYLNNQLLGQVAAPGSYDYSAKGNGRFILGRINDTAKGFGGYIGDVVMEDTSRGDDWVDEYYNNTCERYIPIPIPFVPGQNTEVYYNFNNQDLSDSSGKGRDSSWYNGTGSFTDGLKGKCAQISGTRGIRLPITLPSGDFTYSICAYTTNLTSPAIQSFLGTIEWGSSANYIHFHWTSSDSQKIVISFSDTTGNVQSSATMEANKWINVILVHSGNKYYIYKNGEKILDFEKAGFTPSAGTWTIGCEYTDGRAINGKIDEVILESQAWSEDRIKGYVSSLGLL